MHQTASPFIVAKKSKIHNTGVYAKKDIPAGTRIIEYVGHKITKAQGERYYEQACKEHANGKRKGLVYLFSLNKRYDINGDVPWNTARFINHSCSPNCEPEIIRGKIWICALRDIKKGEELSYNYGYDLEDFEEHPCRCGSKNCVGYIVDESDWKKLRQLLKQKSLKKSASQA